MAKKTLEFEIKGVKELQKLLKDAGTDGPKLISGPLFRFAEQHILFPARDVYVPVRFGALQKSLAIGGPDIIGTTVEVQVGAGNNAVRYALSVHENPRAGKTGGISPSGKKYKAWARTGQWKYLETPAKEAAAHPEPFVEDVKREVEAYFERRR